MKITEVRTRPLRIPYKTPFHWAQGVIAAAEVILVEVHTDDGVIGYGESMASASGKAVELLIREAAQLCIDRSPFSINPLMAAAYQDLFAARGNCSDPRFGALVLAGLDTALWDLCGKVTGRAVHELLGGAVRDRIQYFGFPQGDSAEELAIDAREWVDRGCEVIYVKIGRGEQLDLAIAKQVRSAIGHRRLRLDANEAWDALTASRMLRALTAFDIEFVEQPTDSNSLSALVLVRSSSPIAIAADQIVFTPQDAYEVCRREAADIIVLGVHETGSIGKFTKVAAIAEAAGLKICLHGLYETGISTCVHNQVGATLPNLDDGNQYMNHLLVEDILDKPDLTLDDGRLAVNTGPGLGFELDWDAVARAEENYREQYPEP